MESIGYFVTNKFILIAVDKNLEVTIGEQDEQLKLEINNAKKVYKISDETAISIIGLPHKITDIYKFILSIQNSNNTYDNVEEDLKSIFNSSLQKVVENIQNISSLIPRFSEENGALKQDELFKHLENDPDLLQITKEAISLLQSKSQLPTRVSIFGRENGQNVFGVYMSIGINLIGNKQATIPKDHIFIGIQSIKTTQEQSKEIEDILLSRIKPFLVNGWEESKELESKLYNACKEQLKFGLTEVTPFKKKPEIIFYELNEQSNFKFKEPDEKLIEVNFNRN